jgi:hypothetical protein
MDMPEEDDTVKWSQLQGNKSLDRSLALLMPHSECPNNTHVRSNVFLRSMARSKQF